MNRLTWLSPIVFVAVMLGGVGIAQLTGDWITSGKQVAVVTGQLAVEDVKGSMSIGTAADGLGMTVDELVSLIDPPDRGAITAATLFKELEALVPGFELSTFRETLRAFLAARSGTSQPTVMHSVTSAPTPAPSPTGTPTATHTSTPTGTGTGKRTR